MSYYDFEGIDCPNAIVDEDGNKAVCHHVIEYRIGRAPKLGKVIKCPVKGCDGKVKRVYPKTFNFIIKGKSQMKFDPGDTVTSEVNGEPVNFTFVDHPETDPATRRRLDQMNGVKSMPASGRNGLSKARYDAKSDQMVVDVVSNVKDPLGKINRQDQHVTKHKVDTPVKRRPKRKGKK